MESSMAAACTAETKKGRTEAHVNLDSKNNRNPRLSTQQTLAFNWEFRFTWQVVLSSESTGKPGISAWLTLVLNLPPPNSNTESTPSLTCINSCSKPVVQLQHTNVSQQNG